jgi:hypothetical protein
MLRTSLVNVLQSPVLVSYLLEVLDVECFDAGVDLQHIQHGVDDCRPSRDSQVLLQAQHPPTCLKLAAVAADVIEELRQRQVLQADM